MTESVPESQQQSPRPLPFRFSLGTLLLTVTVVCLALALILTHRRLARMERELAEIHQERLPLSAEEVARQFEEGTTLGPISTTVKDVRYSPAEDAYKVDLSWTDATTGNSWSTDVILSTDGYGTYFGRIRNRPFIELLGHEDGFTVAVKTPSPLAE